MKQKIKERGTVKGSNGQERGGRKRGRREMTIQYFSKKEITKERVLGGEVS